MRYACLLAVKQTPYLAFFCFSPPLLTVKKNNAEKKKIKTVAKLVILQSGPYSPKSRTARQEEKRKKKKEKSKKAVVKYSSFIEIHLQKEKE